MEAIVKSLNQSDLVEGGSFTNKRQPIRSAPRSASESTLSICLPNHEGNHMICHAHASVTYCLECDDKQ